MERIERVIYSAYADIDGMGTEWVDGLLRGIGHADGDGTGSDRVVGLLEKLSNAAGPPGAEEPVRAIMVGEMKPLATEPLRYDGTGR